MNRRGTDILLVGEASTDTGKQPVGETSGF